MAMISNNYEKTVCIPVRVVKGRITYFYDGKTLDLEDGAIGDLILPEQYVKDAAALRPMQEEREILLQPAGAVILLGMRHNHIPARLKSDTFRPEPAALEAEYRFAPIVLTTDLTLLLRGTKKAVLRDGACWLPALHRPAISLNHAYALLSDHFEPARASHTGNVFQRGLYHDSKGWRRLEDARERHEAAYEDDALVPKRRRKPAATGAQTAEEQQTSSNAPAASASPVAAQEVSAEIKALRNLAQQCANAHTASESLFQKQDEVAACEREIIFRITELYKL